MTIVSWPYPSAPALASAGPPLFRPERPAAVVAVLVRKGGARRLTAALTALARSREAGGIRLPPGPVAVLVLAADPAALPIVEEAALDYPFPIQIEIGAADARRAAQRAAAWVASLGAPAAPVLITDVMARPSQGM